MEVDEIKIEGELQKHFDGEGFLLRYDKKLSRKKRAMIHRASCTNFPLRNNHHPTLHRDQLISKDGKLKYYFDRSFDKICEFVKNDGLSPRKCTKCKPC